MQFIEMDPPIKDRPLEYYLKMYDYLKQGKNTILRGYTAKKMKELEGVFAWGTFTLGLTDEITEAVSGSRIAVCILTYNNRINISECLAAARNIADSIVVVDSQSTDGTYEIAKEMADTIMSVNNECGYDVKRNLAIKNADADWIFMLDSDETISVNANEYIRKAISYSDKEGIDVLWFTRYWLVPKIEDGNFYYYNGHHFLWPDPQARLFRKKVGIYYERNLHERITSENDYKACLFAQPECALIHYKYFISSKSERERELARREQIENGGPDDIQFFPEKYGYCEAAKLEVELYDEIRKLLIKFDERNR